MENKRRWARIVLRCEGVEKMLFLSVDTSLLSLHPALHSLDLSSPAPFIPTSREVTMEARLTDSENTR